MGDFVFYMTGGDKMYHYYMFNKPFGCVTAARDERYPVVMDYFKELNNPNLSPVGRLDLETEGLLIITDDGKWNQKMIHPSYQKEKRYEFIAMGILTKEKIHQLEHGVLLQGTKSMTSPAKVKVLGCSTLCETLPDMHPEIQKKFQYNRPDHPIVKGSIIITEGKKRQIRRMLKAVGCCVIGLKRLSIDDIYLDEHLAPGQWKEICFEELKESERKDDMA